MNRALRRGADLERAAARALGGVRTARIGSRRGEQDVSTIVVGETRLVAEAKYRERIPRLLTRGLAQAQSYDASATPVLIVRERGGRALLVVELDVACRLLGIPAAEIPSRATRTRRPRPDRQMPLFGSGGGA